MVKVGLGSQGIWAFPGDDAALVQAFSAGLYPYPEGDSTFEGEVHPGPVGLVDRLIEWDHPTDRLYVHDDEYTFDRPVGSSAVRTPPHQPPEAPPAPAPVHALADCVSLDRRWLDWTLMHALLRACTGRAIPPLAQIAATVRTDASGLSRVNFHGERSVRSGVGYDEAFNEGAEAMHALVEVVRRISKRAPASTRAWWTAFHDASRAVFEAVYQGSVGNDYPYVVETWTSYLPALPGFAAGSESVTDNAAMRGGIAARCDQILALDDAGWPERLRRAHLSPTGRCALWSESGELELFDAGGAHTATLNRVSRAFWLGDALLVLPPWLEMQKDHGPRVVAPDGTTLATLDPLRFEIGEVLHEGAVAATPRVARGILGRRKVFKQAELHYNAADRTLRAEFGDTKLRTGWGGQLAASDAFVAAAYDRVVRFMPLAGPKRRKNVKLGEQVQALALCGDGALVASLRGSTVVCHEMDGSIRWTRALPGADQLAIVDGTVWVAVLGTPVERGLSPTGRRHQGMPAIVALDKQTGETTWQAEEVQQILALGSAGALVHQADVLGRFDPNGRFLPWRRTRVGPVQFEAD